MGTTKPQPPQPGPPAAAGAPPSGGLVPETLVPATRALVADGRPRKLSPESVTVARITAVGWIAGIGFVNLIGLMFPIFLAPLPVWSKVSMLCGWAVIYGGLAVFSLWWAGLRYRHISYRIDSTGFTILRGVVFRSINTIPRSRIQHTDVSQGPLQRVFELATLVVHTAGTENASISLSGLTHDDALKIRDHLIEVGDSDAV